MADQANGGETPTGATHEGVLAAIDEALGLGASDEQDTGAADTGAEGDDSALETEGDPSADEGAEGADNGDEQGGDEAGGDEPEGKGVKAADAEGADKSGAPPDHNAVVREAGKLGIDAKHANGRFKSTAELQAEITAKQGDAAAAKKAADPLNDPIPKDVGQPAQERIRSLIKLTKEADQRATQAEGNFNEFVQGLQAAGVTPEQYGETVSFLALFNSNDPNAQAKALDILDDMADKLATFLGRERRSTDPLQGHADLQAAVQNRQITPQLARETAIMRNQGKFRQEINTAAQNSQTQQQQAAQERQTAVQTLNELETQLAATDPLYERKKAAIVPALKAAFQHIPPRQWKAAFEQAYRTARVAPIARARVPANQPMRAGKNPAGSGANSKTGGSGLTDSGPKSMLDAVNAALAGR